MPTDFIQRWVSLSRRSAAQIGRKRLTGDRVRDPLGSPPIAVSVIDGCRFSQQHTHDFSAPRGHRVRAGCGARVQHRYERKPMNPTMRWRTPRGDESRSKLLKDPSAGCATLLDLVRWCDKAAELEPTETAPGALAPSCS
jgi:hypothetical protein